MNVAILGSGLAAAFAYRACLDCGVVPTIFSATDIGAIPAGAVWLHSLPESIPGIPMRIANISIGTKQGYLIKQWGRKQGKDWKTSFPGRTRLELGYEIKIYLPKIWEGAKECLIKQEINTDTLHEIKSEFDLVIQTFPRREDIELRQQYFVHIPIATAMVEKSPQKFFPKLETDAVVVYNGSIQDSWVRKTYFPDRICAEYPCHAQITNFTEVEGIFQISKYPDLHPETPKLAKTRIDNLLLVGRLATWNRKYLSDQAYHDTIGAICNV